MRVATKDYIGAVQRFEPEKDVVYTIEAAGHIAHTPRRMILMYYKLGLISPVTDPAREGYYFDAEGVRKQRSVDGGDFRPLPTTVTIIHGRLVLARWR